MQITANQDNYDLSGVVSPSRRIELFNAACADPVLAPTAEEKNDLLSLEPNIEVAVLPHVHEVFSPRIPFAQQPADF